MPRTIIDIPNAQLHAVDRVCRALGISRAEAVRRGLDVFVNQNQPVQEEGFGLWQAAATDSVKLVQAIRSQW